MPYKVTYMWEFDEATIAEFDLIEERYPTVYLWEDSTAYALEDDAYLFEEEG